MNTFDELQLKFDLDLDEIEEDASQRAISYAEARQISEAARQAFDQLRLVDRDEPGRGWFDDYLGLIEKGWPWRVACYMAWASSPKKGRKPKTLKELADKVLGLSSPRVIFMWRQKYPAINTMVAMMQAAPLWDHRRDVIEALVEVASRGDYKSFNDRKLFLELIGDYVPKSQLDLKGSIKGGIEGMSDDELVKWLENDEIATKPSVSRNDRNQD